MHAIQVSVVLPTYKRPKLLKRCLEALSKQCLASKAYEIIVVDDADSQATRRLVRGFSENNYGNIIRYISTPHTTGPAAARNAGWRAARGEIIAFTDDDCIPTSNWLKQGLEAFEGDVAGVSGRLVVPLPESPTDYEKDAAHLSRSGFVTANCFYRRSALDAVGGFDERFDQAWREDTDLYFRMAKRFIRLIYARAAIVIHPVRPESWGISLKQQRKSMYNALLFKKHPDLYRKQVQRWPPWKYYVIVACALTSLGAVVFDNPPLGSLTFSSWMAMTLAFAIQRLRETSRSPSHIVEMIVTSLFIPPLSVFWRLYGGWKYRVLFF